MKKILFNIFLSIIIVFGLSGCYTIIWSPDTEFPNEENSDNSTVYYGDAYYGDYYFWYDVPWWYDYVPPVTQSSNNADRNTETGRLRDTGNGRSEAGRIIDVQPPSRDQGQSGDSSNKGSSGNSGNTSGNTSTRNSSSDSSSSSGTSNSSGSGSTRNSDGGRSSGGRR